MKIKAKHAPAVVPAVVLATALAAFGWAVVSGAAHAGNDLASQHAALRKACTEQGGRFEQSWIYNDQGIRWGEVRSCSTSAGYITCQGNFCRGGRWAPLGGVPAAAGRPENDGAMRFPAEPAAFSDALAVLSGK